MSGWYAVFSISVLTKIRFYCYKKHNSSHVYLHYNRYVSIYSIIYGGYDTVEKLNILSMQNDWNQDAFLREFIKMTKIDAAEVSLKYLQFN